MIAHEDTLGSWRGRRVALVPSNGWYRLVALFAALLVASAVPCGWWQPLVVGACYVALAIGLHLRLRRVSAP